MYQSKLKPVLRNVSWSMKSATQFSGAATSNILEPFLTINTFNASHDIYDEMNTNHLHA